LNASRTTWWRPEGTWGRVALACGLLVAASASAYAYYECKSFFEHDTRFRIAGTSNIQAVGLAEVNRAEILSVFGEDIGRNIFFVPLSERRKQLEQIPWIQQATVMRLLPDQIRISIIERQPIAFVRHGQQIGLVDANGVLLSMRPDLMTEHHYSFPVLTGIDAGDTLSSRKARVDLYVRLMGELDGGGQHLSDQVSEIDLTDPEDARVLMPEQGTDVLAHFGEDHFLERYQRYKAHIAEWRQQYPKLAAVDLRYEQQAVLEMNQGQTNTQPLLNAASATPVVSKPMAPDAAPANAKPDAGKRASVETASSIHETKKPVVVHNPAVAHAVVTHPAVAHTAAAHIPVAHAVVAHPVAGKHVPVKAASSKKPAKATLKTASVKSKGKKHTAAKPGAPKQSKQKPKTHVPASAVTGQ
jgi:cell division protein FtsQ